MKFKRNVCTSVVINSLEGFVDYFDESDNRRNIKKKSKTTVDNKHVLKYEYTLRKIVKLKAALIYKVVIFTKK